MRFGDLSFLLLTLLTACGKPSRFELVEPDRTGIAFVNQITETDSLNVLTYENIYNGAGVGAGDLNNDGLTDLVFAANQVSPRVYLNKGDFRFQDITASFPGIYPGQWFSGVALADVNADGWTDVYLTATGSKDKTKNRNRLWINPGIWNASPPVFTEKAGEYGIAGEDQSVAAAFLDYDRDGDLDLYVLNNTVNERMNTSYRKKVTDGSAPNNDRLYRNNGDNTFTDATIQAGITIEGFGLGVAVGDVNRDGYPDIYVSNDYLSNDLLYINQRNGTFRNEIGRYLSYQTTSSMGNDMADINLDGNPDIVTLDMFPESYEKKKQTINGFSYIYYQLDDSFGFERQYLRNMLHVHNGFLNGEMLPFSETGQYAGIDQSNWSWSPLLADFDNDGDNDLLIANGYPRDLTDKDWSANKTIDKGFMSGSPELVNRMPHVKVPNLAFENGGGLRFSKTTGWLPDLPSYSYGAAFADLDNDGDLDYVANNINDPAIVLRNNTREKSGESAHYLRIILNGNAPNLRALGARIDLWCGGVQQTTQQFLTRGYASSMEPVAHFGLGKTTSVDSLIVTWPASGMITVMRNISADQTLVLEEKQAGPPPEVLSEKAMFTQVEGIGYTHVQTDFVDFFMGQKIIPHKFSQIGPRMACGDINGDGQGDLIMGSTNNAPSMVFLRKGAGFYGAEIPGLSGYREYTEAGLAILDIDKDGDNDVVTIAGGYDTRMESSRQKTLYMAVAGGYDAQHEATFEHCLYVNQEGRFTKTRLPVPGFLASVVRACDFDHNGYVDLFIGSRVSKGKFPAARPCRIVRNDHGQLTSDDGDKLELGMVTDAVWTDYDGDGWEDLLVARDWNSLVLLKNRNGKLEEVSIPEFEAHQGIWYSLIAADFDRDGDDDYIAGNLGENSRFQASDKYPMNIYALDLDMDGILDPLMTVYWKNASGEMTKYPANYLDELREQSSFFHMKFRDYATFSRTPVESMIDEKIAERLVFRLRVNTLSSWVIWNDKGKFTFEKLPQPVQLSPLTAMAVCDVNADGYPDVVAGGNDYGWEVSTGNMDANKGLLLLNRGDRKEGSAFACIPPAKSGLFMPGMVQSLLSVDDDSLMIIAGINRTGVMIFKKTSR